MGETPRVQREPAARTAPIREASMMFRPALPRHDPDDREGGHPRAHEAREAGEAPRAGSVEHGVATAYRVVDDYLRRGRQAARRHAGTAPPAEGTRPMNGNVQDVAWKAMRLWADVMALWVDYVGPLVPGGPGAVPPDGVARDETPSPVPAPAPTERLTVAVEVTSARPARVTLDLHPGVRAGDGPLAVQELRAIDGADKAPLRDVALRPGTGGAALLVTVTVPPDQPAGVYLGAVFDAAQGEPRGTLRVVIRA